MKIKDKILSLLKTDGAIHFIAISLIILSIVFYQINIDIETLESNNNRHQLHTSKLEWNVVRTTLEDEIYKAQLQTNLVSEIITSEILSQYDGQMDILLNDLTTYNKDAELYRILNKEIQDRYINKDNQTNTIFITTKENVLSTVNPPDGYVGGSKISDYFSMSNMPSIETMLSMKDNYSVIHFPSDDNKIYGLNDLKEVYETMGLDGFKDFYLLVPGYITKKGDIFGINDMNQLGEKQENHKIYVIQQVNVYDALCRQDSVLVEFSHFKEVLNLTYLSSLRMKYYTLFTIAGIFIILAIFAMFYRNCSIDRHKE